MLAQLFGTQSAVEADRHRGGVSDRIPERFSGLARQGTAAGVGDRTGDDQRQFAAGFPEQLLAGVDRRLGVQGVEHGFEQEQVGAAARQATDRVEVIGGETVEIDVAETRIVDVRRQRAGAAGRPDGAGDKAGPVTAGLELVDGLAGEAGRRLVELRYQPFGAVVALRHGGRIERVRADHVRPGFQVGPVDVPDHVRPRQAQQVVVPLERLRVVPERVVAVIRLRQLAGLDHRAHRAIENQDALAQRLPEAFLRFVLVQVSSPTSTDY